VATRYGTILGGLAAGAAIKATKEFGGVERQLVRVRSIVQGTDGDWQKIVGTLRKVVLESEFTWMEIGKSAEKLAAMGVHSPAAFESMMPAIRAMATVLGVGIEEASEILKKSMNQFKIDISDASTVVETFANSWRSSAADAEKVATALRFVGPTASITGEDFKDVVAMIGALADRGLEASIVGTSMRNILSRLGKETKPFTAALLDLGLAFSDVSIHEQSMIDALQRLVDAGATAEDFMKLFNIRGAGVAAMLSDALNPSIDQSSKSVRELRIELDRTGFVQSTLNAINQTTAQRFDILRGSVNNAWVQLGSLMDRSIGVKDGLGAAVTAVNEFALGLEKVTGGSARNLFDALLDDLSSEAFIGGIIDIMAEITIVMGRLMLRMGNEIAGKLMDGINTTIVHALPGGTAASDFMDMIFGASSFADADMDTVFGIGISNEAIKKDALSAFEKIRKLGLGSHTSTALDRIRQEMGGTGPGHGILSGIGFGNSPAEMIAEANARMAALTEALNSIPGASVEQPMFDARRQTFYINGAEDRTGAGKTIDPTTGGR